MSGKEGGGRPFEVAVGVTLGLGWFTVVVSAFAGGGFISALAWESSRQNAMAEQYRVCKERETPTIREKWQPQIADQRAKIEPLRQDLVAYGYKSEFIDQVVNLEESAVGSAASWVRKDQESAAKVASGASLRPLIEEAIELNRLLVSYQDDLELVGEGCEAGANRDHPKVSNHQSIGAIGGAALGILLLVSVCTYMARRSRS